MTAGGNSRTGALIRMGVAVVAVGAIAGAATVLDSDGSEPVRPTSDREPLTDVVLVCPDSVAGEDGEPSSTIGAVSAPVDVPRPSGKGELSLREMAEGGADGDRDDGAGEDQGDDSGEGQDGPTPRDSASEQGRTVTTAVRKSGVLPILARGTGSLAPAIGASVSTEADSGQWAGLAETGCDRPDSEFWFVGASAEQGQHPRLFLTNIESTDARVTVAVWDSQGEVQTEQVRGVDIAARDRLVVDLDEVAPLSSELAVRVTAERGRVAAGLLDRAVEESESVGIDWLDASTPPSRSQLIPGAVPGKGARELTLVAPGDSSATVKLSLLGENGEFQPAEPKQVQVEAGTVTQVNLAKATAGQATGVRLESDVPVTGSLRSVREGDSDRDFAYTPTVRPFRTPAVLGTTAAGDDREATLILSNPGEEDGKATVSTYAPGGKELTSTPVEIAAGATVTVDLPSSEQEYSTVVEPKGTPLIGSRVLTDGTSVSNVPLRPAPLDALRPVVEPDPAAGLG